MKTEKSLMSFNTIVVDGNNLAYRANSKMKLNTRQGISVGAIFGFIKDVKAILANFDFNQVIVVWDGGSEARKTIYEDYKNNRRRDHSEQHKQYMQTYYDQIEEIKKILTALGVTQYYSPGTEADDLVSCLVKLLKPACAVSSDSDYFQLIDEKTCVYTPNTKRLLTLQKFLEDFRITPRQFLDVKILMGDSSDGIPGVGGIGEVYARKIVEKWGSLNDFLIKSQDSTVLTKQEQKVLESRKILARNSLLIDLSYSTNWLAKSLNDCKVEGTVDKKFVEAKLKQFELYSFLKPGIFESIFKVFGGNNG